MKIKLFVMKRTEKLIYFTMVTIGYLLFGHLFITGIYHCDCSTQQDYNAIIKYPSISDIARMDINNNSIEKVYTYNNQTYLINDTKNEILTT